MGPNFHRHRPSATPLLGGRYQVIQPLGGGGFGQTFLACDQHLPGQPRCVIKQLRPQIASAQALQVARRLFETEANTLYRLGNHATIPSLLAHFEEQGNFYLAQELIEGHALEAELTGAPWSQPQVVACLGDLLRTLACVHGHHVIHRDLKPANLIRRQQDHRIVVIDFGAVKQVSTQLTAATSRVSHTISIGTQGYMPSEQIAGRPHFSSDLYAVGMIAIQALTGHHPTAIPLHPHTSEVDWHDLAPHCHPALKALLDTMVRYDFRSRYPTAAEALAALEALPAPLHQGATPAPASLPPAPNPPASPSRAVPTVAVGRAATTTTPASSGQTEVRSRSRRPRARSSSKWPLVVGMAIALGFGSGALAWRLFAPAPPSAPTALSSPDRPTPAPTLADATPTPEPTPEPPAAQEPPPAEPTPEAPEAPTLAPATAEATIRALYSHVSNRSWPAAQAVLAGSLAQQFDPGFFQQFQRVTVENLRITSQTADTIEFLGQNTYLYPDGSSQQEDRTFTVQLIDGQPRIIASDFVRVTKARGH